MKNEHVLFELQLNDAWPVHCGIRHQDPSEPTCTVWALFTREEAERVTGWVPDTGNTELAERLTGWYGHSPSSPGGRFSEDPSIIVSHNRVLVTQRRGRDV